MPFIPFLIQTVPKGTEIRQSFLGGPPSLLRFPFLLKSNLAPLLPGREFNGLYACSAESEGGKFLDDLFL
jgi:hypothetical protein